MRYLSFLAAILASAPACAAEFTDTIVLPPGFAVKWQSPRPFKNVILGDANIIDAVASATDRELIITTKPLSTTNPVGGNTNFLLLDENGKQVANVLVTRFRYELARSATGTWQLYRGGAD